MAPLVVTEPRLLVDEVLERISISQLASDLLLTESDIRARQNAELPYTENELLRLVEVCHEHGLWDLLPPHGVEPRPFNLNEHHFDLESEPIGAELAPVLPSEFIDRPTSIGGFPVGFPLALGASILGSNATWLRYFGMRGFDILTYKTVRSEPRDPHPWPDWVFVENPVELRPPFDDPVVGRTGFWPDSDSPVSMANSFGVPSLPREWWMADVRRVRGSINPDRQVLIVSVQGSKNGTLEELSDDFVKTALLAKEAGAQIVEANFSCPNTVGNDRAGDLFRDPENAAYVARQMKAALDDTPLFVKIGYLPEPELTVFFKAVHEHIDGIVAINTISVPVVRDRARGLQTFPDNDELVPAVPRDRAGVSGFAIKRWSMEVNLNLVRLKREHPQPIGRLPLTLIAIGGVLTPQDIHAYLEIGVDAVGSVTGAFLNPRIGVEARTPVAADLGGEVSIRIKERDERKEVNLPNSFEQQLRLAMNSSSALWRTVDGVARELDTDPEQVRQVLSKSEGFVQSSRSRPGQELWTTREHFRAKASLWTKIRGGLAGRAD